MKNITFSADEYLIEAARMVAKEQHTTLNEAFRKWLTDFTEGKSEASAVEDLYRRLKYVNSGGRKYSREEMNER